MNTETAENCREGTIPQISLNDWERVGMTEKNEERKTEKQTFWEQPRTIGIVCEQIQGLFHVQNPDAMRALKKKGFSSGEALPFPLCRKPGRNISLHSKRKIPAVRRVWKLSFSSYFHSCRQAGMKSHDNQSHRIGFLESMGCFCFAVHFFNSVPNFRLFAEFLTVFEFQPGFVPLIRFCTQEAELKISLRQLQAISGRSTPDMTRRKINLYGNGIQCGFDRLSSLACHFLLSLVMINFPQTRGGVRYRNRLYSL